MNQSRFTRASGLAAMLVLGLSSVACGGGDTTTNTAVDATGDISVGDFTDALAGYGAWVDVAPYGKVWQPSEDVVGSDFVPYATDGHWALNDDGDWVFTGKHDDEFGWATYHYGRWVASDDFGWVWVPGTEWAPAWVDWRYGGGYTAWVPMAPEGVTFTPDRWVVVEEGHFVDDNVVHVRVEPARVTTVWASISPVVDVRAGAHFHIGPAVSHWQGKVATISMKRPEAGAVRIRAKAVAAKVAGKVVAPKPRSGAVKASVSVAVPAVAAHADVKAEVKAEAKVDPKAAGKGKVVVPAAAPPKKEKAPPPKKKD